jgi:hypothetical protein
LLELYDVSLDVGHGNRQDLEVILHARVIGILIHAEWRVGQGIRGERLSKESEEGSEGCRILIRVLINISAQQPSVRESERWPTFVMLSAVDLVSIE